MRPYGSVRGASGNGRPYRDSTQIENNELELVLSVFICGQIAFFATPSA